MTLDFSMFRFCIFCILLYFSVIWLQSFTFMGYSCNTRDAIFYEALMYCCLIECYWQAYYFAYYFTYFIINVILFICKSKFNFSQKYLQVVPLLFVAWNFWCNFSKLKCTHFSVFTNNNLFPLFGFFWKYLFKTFLFQSLVLVDLFINEGSFEIWNKTFFWNSLKKRNSYIRNSLNLRKK